MKRIILFLLFFGANELFAQSSFSMLQEQFKHLADGTRPGCFWYWLNDNVSKEGITKDLEAMQRVGIGKAFIGQIYDRRKETDTPPGTVKFMSDEWWQLLQWAVKEADRCNIEIGFFNGPGWSQSGGPWVKLSESMRYITSSEIEVKGGKLVDITLPYPAINTYPNTRAARVRTGPDFTAASFQDVRVIAFPKITDRSNAYRRQMLHSSISNIGHLSDGIDSTFAAVETGQWQTIDLELTQDSYIQNIVLKPFDYSFQLACKISVSANGKQYREIAQYNEERGHQGAGKTDPLIIPFKRTKGKFLRIRLLFKPLSGQQQIRISELKATDEHLLAGYVRKKLSETSPYTKVPWDAYVWKPQAENKVRNIQSGQVIDLTDRMDNNGRLRWNAPGGDWVIQRFGMVPNGTQCHPCGPGSLGFEVDKMNREYVQSFFEGMVGEFLKRTPAQDRKALKYVIADSYETGPQNWTDDFTRKFEQRYHYSPVPYLPVLSGKVVNDAASSDRFLWDFRQLIATSVANDYVGGLKDICNKNGLQLLTENYGHWGFISEFLLYGSRADAVSGEIWENRDPVNNIENRAAASAAHIYGKNTVYTEAFTANRNFLQSPASLKKWCDWAYSSGINHMVLHVYIHQPDERKPGIISWFGTPFNRHNTWFEQSGAFIDYMRRSAVLLKTGTPHADIAYYIGENAPSMQSAFHPALPAGYDFDHVNAEVLRTATVVNNRLHLRSGVSYAVLVLPPVKEMRPEIAARIQELVKQGLIVIGPKPSRNPSLENFPAGDLELKKLVNELWGDLDGKKQKARPYGKGWLYDGLPLETVLKKHGVQKYMELLNAENLPYGVAGNGTVGVDKTGAILFKHRTGADHDVYFVANTTEKKAHFTASFRIAGKRPYFFNAVTGSIAEAPSFRQRNGRTEIPLHLEESESIFVVFAGAIDDSVYKNEILPTPAALIRLDTNWTVQFNDPEHPFKKIFPVLTDWTSNEDAFVKYYSGTAIYSNTFHLNIDKRAGYLLDLGTVADIASVSINNKEVGTVWTKPWTIDITTYLEPGVNTITIKVANSWNNRLVADMQKKINRPPVYLSQPYTADKEQPYKSSGLLGPVTIKKITIK